MADWPVSLDDARSACNIPDGSQDAELQGFLDAVTEVVEDMVGPVNSAAYTDSLDGGGTTVVLSHYPVLTLTTVTEYDSSGVGTVLANEPLGTAPYTDTAFRANLEVGELTRTSGGRIIRFATGTRNIVVAYTAGRATVPSSVRTAALEAVRMLWAKSQGMGASEYPVSLSEIDMTYLANLLTACQRAPRMGAA